MKLALHIGTPKTGTTSLQRWCATHRGALAERGVRYPEVFGAESHRRLMVYARDTDRPDESFARFGVTDASGHARFRAELETGLDREIAAHPGCPLWVVSNEHLYSKITSEPMLVRLRDFLAARFAEVTVYLHLRPQVDLLISNASQLARMGRIVSRAELARESIGPRNLFYGYDRTVAEWEAVFGARRLRLVPFRREPDILAVLLRELAIDATGLAPPERVNEALDWRAMALANAIRLGMAAAGGGRVPDFHLDRLAGAERLALGRALAEEIQARFSAANARLADRRTDITAADLTPDWALHPVEGNLHLLDAPCLFAPQLAQAVTLLARDRALETWRRLVAEGRLAAALGDRAGSARAEEAAVRAVAELEGLGIAAATGAGGGGGTGGASGGEAAEGPATA